MKYILFLSCILITSIGCAQERKYSTFYEQRKSLFDLMPITSDDIVFLGNSITNGGEWHELLNHKNIKNRGISGDITEGIYDRLDNIVKGNPKKIFLLIGTNDIARNIPLDTIAANIERIILKIQTKSPTTELYLQSVLPVNPDFGMFKSHIKSDVIEQLNHILRELAQQYKLTYIDLFSFFTEEGSNKLFKNFTNDGLHLMGEGYLLWCKLIRHYLEIETSYKYDNISCESLPSYPIKKGISAPFIGVLGNMLIVGGGCNFPEISAAEGGKKVFYNEVYAVDISGETNNIVWKVCPSLPQKAAYGVSVKTDKGIVWVGGQNESTSLSDVWLLEYDKTKGLSYTSLPSLPVKLVNGCGTSHNNIIYISGGVHDGTEKCNLYSLDLNNPSSAWNTTKTNYPYERQQAVLLFHNNELLLAGGYDEKEAIAFTDILRFDFQKGIWIKYSNITDNNDYTGTFIGATGFSYQEELLFVGGVNYKIFSEALLRIRKIQDAKEGGKSNLLSSLNKEAQEYMTHPAAWYKFRKHLQLYNPKTGKWKYSKAYESFARAGAGTVIWKDRLFVVCGETKPGIRTAEVNSFKLK